MTSLINLQKKITIESQYLDSNIKENILKKIKNITNNECSKEYGYYLNIIKINNILDNYISSNCENIFIVEFQAEILKPEINKKYEGKVCMLFGGGIFLNVLNRLKILIPLSTITDYEYNQIKNNFTNKKNGKVINLNDDLKVIISGTKYSKQNFSCFGKLLED